MHQMPPLHMPATSVSKWHDRHLLAHVVVEEIRVHIHDDSMAFLSSMVDAGVTVDPATRTVTPRAMQRCFRSLSVEVAEAQAGLSFEGVLA